jgi:hypothetical protein
LSFVLSIINITLTTITLTLTLTLTNMSYKQPSKLQTIGKWISGLVCGSISALTCACCCGCCGNLKAPEVLYDEDELYNGLDESEKKMFNTVQWCGLCGLTIKTITSCGCCCCGCFGQITPVQAIECMAKQEASKKSK